MHILYSSGGASYGMSTLVSYAIIVGAVYGCVRLAYDIFHGMRYRIPPPAAPPTDEDRQVGAADRRP
jgi:hypothetical protein